MPCKGWPLNRGSTVLSGNILIWVSEIVIKMDDRTPV